MRTSTSLRLLTAVLAGGLCCALPAMAESSSTPLPTNLQPLPEPPPPPPGYRNDDALEPQITITHRGETKEEEFRLNGKLYMVKVTPPHGVPYYLVDARGDGVFSRVESMDSGLRVPMWVIKNF